MKPRTKLQKTVAGRVKSLPALSKYQREEAIRHGAPHIAKRNSKGVYLCTDCLHEWKGVDQNIVRCPHCGSVLNVSKGRKYNHSEGCYFATISRHKEFQVIRQYLMNTHIKRGKPAKHVIQEVFQRWIAPDGKQVIVSLKRLMFGYHVDNWDRTSNLEIRQEHMAHSLNPYMIVGKTSVSPTLRRNGFDGNVHNCNPHILLPKLIMNNRIETLWKAGRYKIVDYVIHSYYSLERYWDSIKIALRHKYQIDDPSMWFDLLQVLSRFNKDLHNPAIICPANLKNAHDLWQHKLEVRREREYHQRRADNEAREEKRYLADAERMAKDERKYAQAKSRFFDIELKDEDMVIKPLTSIRDFIDEWKTMHHCVFTNKYYEKPDSLILRATIGSESVATIELSLSTLKVVQCRGAYNLKPQCYDRVMALIGKNIEIFANKITA